MDVLIMENESDEHLVALIFNYFHFIFRSKRSIAPNEGFTEQLIELSDSIHSKPNK